MEEEKTVEPAQAGFYIQKTKNGALRAVLNLREGIRKILQDAGWENKDQIWVEPVENGKGMIAFRRFEDLVEYRESRSKMSIGEHASTPTSPPEQQDTTTGVL